MIDLDRVPRSRAEAKADGSTLYFTGKPCPNGHIAPRFVSNYGCAECLRLQNRSYYERNREAQQARCRAYAKRNPERNNALSKRWYWLNREQVLSYHRLRHAINPQVKRRAVSEWIRNHPEQVAAQRRLRRARIKGARGRVTAREWIEIKNRYGNRCLCCGAENVPLDMDHVIPLALGGTHTPDNVQPLCSRCNRSKYLKSTDYRKAVS